MRVLLLTLLLVAGSQANFLTDIGDAFKTTFNSLVDQGKQVGQDLLDQLKVTGAQLASQGLQALMLNVADALTSTDAPTTAEAKRQLDPNMQGVQDPNGVIFNHADELKQYMQAALNASHHMDNHEKYEQTILDFMHMIDQVVASHGVSTTPSFKKRDLDEALAPLKSMVGMVMAHSNQLKNYMHTALAALGGMSQFVDRPETYENIMSFLKNVDQIIADHNTSVDAVVNTLVQEVASLMPATGNKRSLATSMNIVGQSMAKVFQPHAEGLKGMVASIGQILKNTVTRVFTTLVSSANNLDSEVLIKQHMNAVNMESAVVSQVAQNAFNTLKSALGGIMQEALTSMKPHLANIAKEVLSAVGH